MHALAAPRTHDPTPGLPAPPRFLTLLTFFYLGRLDALPRIDCCGCTCHTVRTARGTGIGAACADPPAPRPQHSRAPLHVMSLAPTPHPVRRRPRRLRSPAPMQRGKYTGTITPGPMPQPGLYGDHWHGPAAPPPYPGDIEAGSKGGAGHSSDGGAAAAAAAHPLPGWEDGTVVAELVVRPPHGSGTSGHRQRVQDPKMER
jgi:hypothetical protein